MVIRQHFLPNFILKRWSTMKNERLFFKVFDKNKNTYESIEVRSQDDPFFKEYFYELNISDFAFNEIEHKLGEIENEFHNITKKVLDKWNQYHSVRINRKELIILKIFICLQIFRSNDLIEKSQNLDGDFVFNSFLKNKTETEIKTQQLKDINFLYYFFKKVKTEVDLDEVLKIWKYQSTRKYFENSEDAFSSERLLKQLLQDTFLNFLEINSELSEGRSFILTDSGPVHAVGVISSAPLIFFYPLTPKICIALVNWSFGENSFLPKEILLAIMPGLEIEKEHFDSFYNDSTIWKRNYRQKWKEEKEKLNYQDLFIYEKRFISYQQIKLINSLIYSQNKSYIVCLNEGDVQDIDPRITRIEEINR